MLVSDLKNLMVNSTFWLTDKVDVCDQLVSSVLSFCVTNATLTRTTLSSSLVTSLVARAEFVTLTLLQIELTGLSVSVISGHPYSLYNMIFKVNIYNNMRYMTYIQAVSCGMVYFIKKSQGMHIPCAFTF